MGYAEFYRRSLEDLPAYFEKMLKGQIRGRAVVKL